MGSISNSEWEEYNKEFYKYKNEVEDIDLFIFLKCELQENIRRIKTRNRSYDESKETNYLLKLDEKYKSFKQYVRKELPMCEVFEVDTTCMTPIEVLYQIEKFIFARFVEDQIGTELMKQKSDVKS